MSSKNKRILYVEDHEDSRLVVSTILKLHGFNVITANTAADGLRIASSGQFDLFLIDSRLPDFSGLELCSKIRASDPRTPVVFFSALGSAADEQAAFSAGAQAYIVKPAEPVELIQVIRTALNGVPATQRSRAVPNADIPGALSG